MVNTGLHVESPQELQSEERLTTSSSAKANIQRRLFFAVNRSRNLITYCEIKGARYKSRLEDSFHVDLVEIKNLYRVMEQDLQSKSRGLFGALRRVGLFFSDKETRAIRRLPQEAQLSRLEESFAKLFDALSVIEQNSKLKRLSLKI